MSCDTDHIVILKHRTAATLKKAVNRFNKLSGEKPSKISKTSAKWDIFRNESNWDNAYCVGKEDTVANLAIRLAWDYPGLKLKYESKNEYQQFEECEVCISTEAKDALDTLIESAEGNPEDCLSIGVLYMEDDSNVLELNDHEQPEPHDLQEALKWIQSAAEAGLSEAHLKLGGMYDEGKGVPEDKTQGLAHALVAQKLDGENEDVALLINKISGGLNKKEKEKAQKLAEDIAGEIDTADIISTRSLEEVRAELHWILFHDDLKSLKRLVGTADYANAMTQEYAEYYITFLVLYRKCFEYGAYSCAAYLGGQGFFSPVFDKKPAWDTLLSYIDREEVYWLSSKKPAVEVMIMDPDGNDEEKYERYQPASDKTAYYWNTKKDDKKALDKFLGHILSDHPTTPHCINWDRKGAEELLEAAKGKKMSKTVTALNKLLKPA